MKVLIQILPVTVSEGSDTLFPSRVGFARSVAIPGSGRCFDNAVTSGSVGEFGLRGGFWLGLHDVEYIKKWGR